MGFNDYLGPLVNVEGATSISNILLVDVDMQSFSPYIYLSTPWAKHTKTTIRGAPSLENPSCSKSDFSHPSLAVAVAVFFSKFGRHRRSTASLIHRFSAIGEELCVFHISFLNSTSTLPLRRSYG